MLLPSYVSLPFSFLELKALGELDFLSPRPMSKPICILPLPLVPLPASLLTAFQVSNQMVFDFPLAATPQYVKRRSFRRQISELV